MKVHMNCINTKLFKNVWPFPLCSNTSSRNKNNFTQQRIKVTCLKCLKLMQPQTFSITYINSGGIGGCDSIGSGGNGDNEYE